MSILVFVSSNLLPSAAFFAAACPDQTSIRMGRIIGLRLVRDWNSVKTRVREALSSYIYRRTKRSPMILPILMEV